MATLLDVSILEHFGSIFVVFIVFVICFGLLEYIKIFGGERRGLHALLSLFVSLLFLVSTPASNMVQVMVPWFLIIVIFIFFMILMVRMFGLGEGDLKKIIADGRVYPWIIIFSLLVLISSFSAVFGQFLLEQGSGGNGNVTSPVYDVGGDLPAGGSTSTSDFGTNLLNTLRHPKVLGMVFVMLTGAFVLMFLTSPAKP